MKDLIDIEAQVNGHSHEPSQHGEILESGVYEGANGLCICWVDFIVDDLLYAVSKKKKGWATLRTEAAPMTDEQKQAQLNNLRYVVHQQVKQNSEGAIG